MPREEIAFIQDYDDDAAKNTLFKAVREGKVRVLLGSTPKMSQRTRRDIHPQRWMQEVHRELYDPDSPLKAAVPADLLTFESLEGGIFANLPAVLANLGLEINPRPMEFDALRRYLRVRWRYFDLDVPHRDILAP